MTKEPNAPSGSGDGRLRELYEQYAARVYTYARYRLPSPEDAEDLTASVFEAAIAGLEGYNPHRGSLSAWLFGIAHRQTARFYRRPRRESPLSNAEEVESPYAGPLEMAILDEQRDALLKAMKRLPETKRDVIALRYVSGLSNGEITEITGLSRGHVAVIAHRALRALKKELKIEEEDQ